MASPRSNASIPRMMTTKAAAWKKRRGSRLRRLSSTDVWFHGGHLEHMDLNSVVLK